LNSIFPRCDLSDRAAARENLGCVGRALPKTALREVAARVSIRLLFASSMIG